MDDSKTGKIGDHLKIHYSTVSKVISKIAKG